MLITNFLVLILFAMGLALLTVRSIPVRGAPDSSQLHALLADGKWTLLSCFYMGLLALGAAGGAAFWAFQATIDCGQMWLLFERRKSKGAKTALPTDSAMGNSA